MTSQKRLFRSAKIAVAVALTLLLSPIVRGEISDPRVKDAVTKVASYVADPGTSGDTLLRSAGFDHEYVATLPAWRTFSTYRRFEIATESAFRVSTENGETFLARLVRNLAQRYPTVDADPDVIRYHRPTSNEPIKFALIAADAAIEPGPLPPAHIRRAVTTLAEYASGPGALTARSLMDAASVPEEVAYESLRRFRRVDDQLTHALARLPAEQQLGAVVKMAQHASTLYPTVVEEAVIKQTFSRYSDEMAMSASAAADPEKKSPAVKEPDIGPEDLWSDDPPAGVAKAPEGPKPPPAGSPAALEARSNQLLTQLKGAEPGRSKAIIRKYQELLQKVNHNETLFRPGGIVFNRAYTVPGVKLGAVQLKGNTIEIGLETGEIARLRTSLAPEELRRIAYVVASTGGVAISQNSLPPEDSIDYTGQTTATFADDALFGTEVLRALSESDSATGELFYGRRYHNGSLYLPPVPGLPNFVRDMVDGLNARTLAPIALVESFTNVDCNPAMTMAEARLDIHDGELRILGPIIQETFAPGLTDGGVRLAVLQGMIDEPTCLQIHRAIARFNERPESFVTAIPTLPKTMEIARIVGVLLGAQIDKSAAGPAPDVLGAPPLDYTPMTIDVLVEACERGEITADGLAYARSILRKIEKLDAKTSLLTVNRDRMFRFASCMGDTEMKSRIIRHELAALSKLSSNGRLKQRLTWLWKYHRAFMRSPQRASIDDLRTLRRTAPNQILALRVDEAIRARSAHP